MNATSASFHLHSTFSTLYGLRAHGMTVPCLMPVVLILAAQASECVSWKHGVCTGTIRLAVSGVFRSSAGHTGMFATT